MPHKLCICQICNCGRHRCPHRNERTVLPVDNTVPCLISEYESRYTGDMAERARSFKPANRPFRIPDTQMEKISTQATDFVAHPVQKTEGFKPHRMYEEPTEAMDLNSTYNTVYFGTQGEREKAYKPGNRVIGGGQFRSDLTSNDYKAWPINKRQLIVPHPQLHVSDVKFFNKSEAQSQFINSAGKAAKSAKPAEKSLICKDPFDNKTSHQLEYTVKAIADRHDRQKVVYQPPTVPHNMSTTYHDDYRENNVNKAASLKLSVPQGRHGLTPMPTTINDHHFIPLSIPEKLHQIEHVYEPVDRPIDLNDAQKTGCQETLVPVVESVKSVSRQQGHTMLRGNTSRHVDYVAWPDSKRNILYGQEEDNKKGLAQSQSQEDYREPAEIVARPVRIRRRFSDQVNFGQDSPTYYSTNHSSYQGLPGQTKLARKMADGVDQSVDHVIFGTSPSSGQKMVSTNHADYLKYPIKYEKHQRHFLNKSGFVLGEGEPLVTFTSTQDHFRHIQVIPSSTTEKTQHQDLFRSSAGLLFGQSSARYVTQSQQDYPSYKDAIPSDRRRAKLNKRQAQTSAGIIFANENEAVGGGGKTTSSDAYGRMEPVERVVRSKRDLFQPTEGFSLSYEGEEEDGSEIVSPRYSSMSRASRKAHDRRKIQLERREISPGENEQRGNEEGWDVYSGNRERQRKQRYKRSQRGRSGGESAVSSALTSQRLRARSGTSTRMTFSQLADQIQNIQHATLDPNGLLWFPVNEENGRRKGLPKWAETALKDNSDREEDNLRQSPSTVSTHPGNYAKQNDQVHSGPAKTVMLPAEKISIPPSSSDEGLVLDHEGSSLINLPQSHDQHQQRHNNIPTTFSTYSPDSMESGRQSEELLSLDGYDSLDNLDSLERARSRSPSRPNVDTSADAFIKASAPMESHLATANSLINQSNHSQPDAEDSSILERTRDKMRIPKLIPLPHDNMDVSRRQSFQQRSQTSEEGNVNSVPNQPNQMDDAAVMERQVEEMVVQKSPILSGNVEENRKEEIISAVGQKNSLVELEGAPVDAEKQQQASQPLNQASSQSAKSLDDKNHQIMSIPQSNSQENQKEENIVTINPQLPENTSNPVENGRPAKNQRSQVQKSTSNQKQIQPMNTQTFKQTVTAPQSLSPTSVATQGRKGRRAMANVNSQRNQYPRSTSLGGIMQQGYREQMTTSQNAYPPQNQQLSSNQPTPKPRFQKKIPISEDGQFIITTSRPLQHSPPSRQSTSAQMAPLTPFSSAGNVTASSEKSSLDQRTPQQTREDSTKKAQDNTKTAGDAITPRQRQKRLSNGQSHQMPANWQPTRPFRYADTLRLFDGEAFDQSSRQRTDYRGVQLGPDSLARPRSLDRKHVFSRPYFTEDLDAKEDSRNGRRQRNRSHDEAPQDYVAIFAQHRRVPFTFKDHDLFHTSLDRDKFDGRTETSEAYKKWEKMAPQLGLVRPTNQLQLFNEKGSGQLLRSVTQDTYQGAGTGRPLPFRPQALLNIFPEDGAAGGANRISTSQDAYKRMPGQLSRRQALRPRSALSGVNGLVGDEVSRGRRRPNGAYHLSTHAAGLASRVDSLPPVRDAVSLSSRSFDEGRIPFSATTTNHADFQDPGSVVRPALFRQYSSGALEPAKNSKVSESTTSNTAFKKYSHQEHLLPILPQENHLFATKERFSNRTTNKDTYQKFQYQNPSSMPTRNRSLPPRISPRFSTSYGSSDENNKERSRFATRTTNMDTYQNYQFRADEGGAQSGGIGQIAAGLRSSAADVADGQVFQGSAKMKTNGNDILAQNQTATCPAELIISGQGKWTFAGMNQGHDYYNLDS